MSLYYCVILIKVFINFFSSLVTTLRVAKMFEKSHLSSPEVVPLIENAKFYYIEGYFLTHCMDSALELSSKSAARGKVILFAILHCFN